MTTSEKQRVWMVFEHPQELANALALASYWGRQRFAFNLLISRHAYWDMIDLDHYRDAFDDIVFVDRVDYLPNPFPAPHRVLKLLRRRRDLAQLKGQSGRVAVGRSVARSLLLMLPYPFRVLKLIASILRLKRTVARLHIQPADAIILLSSFYYLENVVLSMHPHNLKIGIMSATVYDQHVRSVDKSVYQSTLEGWVNNWIVEPIAGLHRTYYMKERLHPELVAWTRFQGYLLDVYDRVLVLGASPEQAGNGVACMPFPYVLAIDKKGADRPLGKRQKVVFFGTNFLGYVSTIIPPEMFARKLDACLSYVREKYGSTHWLVYRPHPHGRKEMELLDLDQFEIEEDGLLSELYLYENSEDIDAVFCVESTSSRSALHCFINAYSFLEVFPYGEEMKRYFRLNFGDVPDAFYINDLSATPKEYVRAEDAREALSKCQHVLDGILTR